LGALAARVLGFWATGFLALLFPFFITLLSLLELRAGREGAREREIRARVVASQ
jgi:hypothetical protein